MGDPVSARRSSARAVGWYLAAITVICVLAVANDLIRRGALIALAVAGTAAGYALGRRHGQRRMASRAIDAELRHDALRRAVDDLEDAAARPIDVVTASYRRIQGQYGG